MDYRKKLRTIRESLGLSQEALGKRIGLTGAHISGLENGKSGITDTILSKYVEGFGVDPEWLYSEDSDNNVIVEEKAIFAGQKIDGFNSLGDRIRELRLEMDMSQKKFAEYAGVQPSDISRVESGKATLGPQTLKRIAEALHVGIEWLQYGDESKKTYPVDGKMIEYLCQNDKLREMIYHYMDEDGGID